MYHCKRFADRSELWIECMLLFLFLTNIHHVECSSQFWERRKCECNLSGALTALHWRGLIGGRPITIQKLIANLIHYNSKSTLQVDLVLFITGSKGGIYSSYDKFSITIYLPGLICFMAATYKILPRSRSSLRPQ